MRLVQYLIIICVLTALTGCTPPPVKYDADEKEAVYRDFQVTQEQLTDWEMNARFAVSTQGKAYSGTIRWVNKGENYSIKLSGPLDQGAVILTGDPTGVTLKDTQGYEGSARTPEAMLTRYTQYEMPISGLRYWVIGLPTPDVFPVLKLSHQGYPTEMMNGEFRIEYQYFREVNEYLLPKKIIIHHPQMKVTLSVYEWKTNNKPFDR